MKEPSEDKYASFKYNGGNGALLCSKCGVIIKTGYQFSKEEWSAVKGETKLLAQFCEKCQKDNYENII